MKKACLAAVCAVTVYALPLQSQSTSTADMESLRYLANACQDTETPPQTFNTTDRPFRAGYCAGYISAATDWLQYVKYLAKSGNTSPTVCLPSNVQNGDLLKVLVKYANDHPEQLHVPAFIGLNLALSQAYPCPAKKP